MKSINEKVNESASPEQIKTRSLVLGVIVLTPFFALPIANSCLFIAFLSRIATKAFHAKDLSIALVIFLIKFGLLVFFWALPMIFVGNDDFWPFYGWNLVGLLAGLGVTRFGDDGKRY